MTKLVQNIINLFNTISRIGVRPETSAEDASYIILNNRNWIYFNINISIYLLYSIVFIDLRTIALGILILMIYSSVIILAYLGRTNFSRELNIYLLQVFVLIVAVLLGAESGFINFFFPLILQIFLLHKISEKHKIGIQSLVVIGTYTAYNFLIDDFKSLSIFASYATMIKFVSTPFQLFNILMIVFLAFRKYEDSQKALAEQKEYLQNIIDSMPFDIAVLDSQLRYKFVNKTAIKNPVTREWIIGKSDEDYANYMHKDLKQAKLRQQNLREALLSKQSQEFEEALDLANDKKITLKVISPVIDDLNSKNNYLICYSIDISRRKQNEEIIRNYSKELEIKNEELKQFAYITSHDLKSPLRNVITLLQLVKKKNQNILDKNSLELVNTSVNSAEHLYRLVNDILLYTTSENSQHEMEKVSLDQVVRTIKMNLGNYLIQRNASILINKALPIIQAHSTLINNLWHNIIENGIKYNDSEKPTITIDYEDKDTQYLFKISDNGIGISEEYKELIFVVFKRLHNQNKYEGTGIGLSICKKIVEKYGGQIWIESTVGQGTTFFFTLPK